MKKKEKKRLNGYSQTVIDLNRTIKAVQEGLKQLLML